MILKVCINCNIEKPKTTEFFYWVKKDNRLNNTCKVCISKKAKIHNEKQEIKEARKAYNALSKIKEAVKKASEIHYKCNKEQVLKKAKERNSKLETKERNSRNSKEWYQKNKEKIREHNIKIGKITGNTQSTQEKQIENWLKERNISFEYDKYFGDCLSPKGVDMPFDFHIEDLNLIIEYDGIHHRKVIWGQETFERTQKHDQIKTDYCFEKRIKLVRITDQQDIKKELNKISWMI